MPKGFKRKNTGVGVDFRRVKHKVGKKLGKAENATDTTIVSRTITLPQQSIATDKTGSALTHRNLSLVDLIAQCGHYSEKVRLEALRGLTELLLKHPMEIEKRGAAASLINAAAERLSDAHPPCRAAVRDLFQRALLPAMGRGAIQPFLPILMAHIRAAMTHLSEDVRSDAVGVLGAVMMFRPDLVARGYLKDVLQHFSDALGRPTRGRSLKAGSLGALSTIVIGLQNFLLTALPALEENHANESVSTCNAEIPTGEATVLQNCRTPPAPLLRASRCLWHPLNASFKQTSTIDGSSEGYFEEAHKLFMLLCDCWMECGPAELGVAPDAAAISCASAIVHCCALLVGHWGPGLILQRDAASFDSPMNCTKARVANLHSRALQMDKGGHASKILDRLTVHFPVREPVVGISGGVREQLIQLNAITAQFLVPFLMDALSKQQALGPPIWATAFLDWVVTVLSNGTALMPSEGIDGSGTNNRLGKDAATRLPVSVYSTALVAISDFLLLLSPDRRLQMLRAVWDLWERTPVRSAIHAHIITFFSKSLCEPAMLLSPSPYAPSTVPLEEAARWVAAMPRFLWELGSSNPGTSMTALRLLLDATRYNNGRASGTDPSPLEPLTANLAKLGPQFIPCFGLFVTEEGTKNDGRRKKKKNAKIGFFPGPLASLPLPAQRLAVDVLFHLPGMDESLLRVIGLIALGGGDYPLETAVRLVDTVGLKASEIDSVPFWGLILSLLIGKSRSGAEGTRSVDEQGGKKGGPKTELVSVEEGSASMSRWERHVTISSAAMRAAFQACGSPGEALTALAPGLISAWRANSEALGSEAMARPIYSLLQLYFEAIRSSETTFLHEEEGVLAKVLPEAAVAYVFSCIECRRSGHGAEPPAAAANRIAVLLIETSKLIKERNMAFNPLLQVIEHVKRCCCLDPPTVGGHHLEGAMTLLKALGECEALEKAMLEAKEEIMAAVNGIVQHWGKDAVQQLAPALVVLSRRLGSDLHFHASAASPL